MHSARKRDVEELLRRKSRLGGKYADSPINQAGISEGQLSEILDNQVNEESERFKLDHRNGLSYANSSNSGANPSQSYASQQPWLYSGTFGFNNPTLTDEEKESYINQMNLQASRRNSRRPNYPWEPSESEVLHPPLKKALPRHWTNDFDTVNELHDYMRGSDGMTRVSSLEDLENLEAPANDRKEVQNWELEHTGEGMKSLIPGIAQGQVFNQDLVDEGVIFGYPANRTSFSTYGMADIPPSNHPQGLVFIDQRPDFHGSRSDGRTQTEGTIHGGISPDQAILLTDPTKPINREELAEAGFSRNRGQNWLSGVDEEYHNTPRGLAEQALNTLPQPDPEAPYPSSYSQYTPWGASRTVDDVFQLSEPMDIAYQLLKESAEGNWGFMNWPKTKPHKEYSSEALGNPSPPAGVTHLYPEGESEAWSILPNTLPFFRNSQGRLDHRPDEELQTAVSSNLAHENVHEGLHSIDEIYGNASQDEYPADISGYLVEMRNKHQQWKNGELPNFGHRRLIEQFTEGMEPEEIAMNEASAQAKRQAQMGDKQNVSGFNVNHFDSDGNLVETGEPMDIAMRLLKERVSPEAKRHKLEYDKKYESSPERVKYREDLNRERRRRGIYGSHNHQDVSHTEGGKLTLEGEHENRARHFKDKGTLRHE